jgi:glycosyltransferase involved in cell wall biosynthesis
VLSTDVGDARVMLNGIAGCAVVEADPSRIAAALQTALASPRRIAGRDKVLRYSVQTTAQSLIALYRDTMGRHLA